MAQSEISKAIKRLNERVADMERHGIQNSTQYKALVGQLDVIAKSSGLALKTTKKGNTAIPNTNKLTEEAQARLIQLSQGKNTYGRAKKQAEMLIQGSIEKQWISKSPKGYEMSDEYLDYDRLKENGYTDEKIREILKFCGYKKSDIDYFINNDEHYLPTIDTYGYTDTDIAYVLELSDRVHEVITQYANAVYKLEDDGIVKVKGNNGRLTLAEMQAIVSVADMTKGERDKMAKEHEAKEERRALDKSNANYQRMREELAKTYGTDADTYEKAEKIFLEWEEDTYGETPSMQLLVKLIENGTIDKYMYDKMEIPFV